MSFIPTLQPNRLLPGPVPYQTGKSPGRFLTGPVITGRISRHSGLLTLTGVLPKCRYHPNWASTNIPESPMVKFTYTYSPAGFSGTVSTGLPLGLIRLSRTALLIQRIHQNTPLLHISGLSPERGYMLNYTIIHFLHMEPSNPPTYYTIIYIYMDICRLYSSNKSTLFTRSCYTSLSSSRTQQRLTRSRVTSKTKAGITPNNARGRHNMTRPGYNTASYPFRVHNLSTAQTNTSYMYIQCECTLATHTQWHTLWILFDFIRA